MMDLAGRKFGKLTVVSSIAGPKYQYKWRCLCECGEEASVFAGNLIRGLSRSCGCSKKRTPENLVDLTGKTFGRLTAIRHLGGSRWECRCRCGTVKAIHTSALRRGVRLTQSCGCLYRETRGTTNLIHGMSKTALYRAWSSMKNRCYLTTCKAYSDYGGRGIVVCERWRSSFENFYADMGDRPSSRHTLERENVNGPYSPDNCAWATWEVQARNKRNPKMITFKGRTFPMVKLKDSIPERQYRLLYGRLLSGWSADRALTTAPINVSSLEFTA